MKKTRFNKFYFGKAEYMLGDNADNEIILNVNYKDNRYNISVINKCGRGFIKLKSRADELATDLLKRKSGVNFVEKLLK